MRSTIELWLVDLEKCAEPLGMLEREVPRLAAADRERADAIGDARERLGRLTAYTALRILLERIAGPAVRGRPFVRTRAGKPSLDVGAEFSLSHIEEHALIAVSPALALGVDLERARPIKMSARRLVEISALGAGLCDKPLPAAAGTERAFLQAWARVEAFAKVRGRGLAQTLADVGVRGRNRRLLSPAEIETRARQIVHVEGLVVHDLALAPALHGAVGAPRGTRPTRVRSFPHDSAGIGRLLAR